MDILTAEAVGQALGIPAPAPISVVEVESRLAVIDQEKVLAEEAGRLAWMLWDKVSPIGEVEADAFLARDDAVAVGPEAAIYVITLDGSVMYFQPHDPEQPGYVAMDEATASARATAHVERLAAEMATARVIQEVSVP